MNFIKETALPLFGILFAVLCVTAVMTVVWLHGLSGECADSGGTFSIEGVNAWCRY